jgi:hypothetical protein
LRVGVPKLTSFSESILPNLWGALVPCIGDQLSSQESSELIVAGMRPKLLRVIFIQDAPTHAVGPSSKLILGLS